MFRMVGIDGAARWFSGLVGGCLLGIIDALGTIAVEAVLGARKWLASDSCR